jgi:hypothetical protein
MRQWYIKDDKKMKSLNKIFVLSLAVFVVFSCKKSELKEPTEVFFSVDINKDTTLNGRLNFTDGQIIIRQLAFDGIRIQGGDVYFEQEFEEGLIAPMSAMNALSQLKFEIPQGSYSSIRIDLEAEQTNFEKIKVQGNFKNSSGDDFPIVLELESIEFYDKIAKNTDGGTNIDLIAGIPTKAIIELNPVYWFNTISSNQLENAHLTSISGVNTILINPQTNENLYDIIADKVNTNIDIIFD